MDGLTLVDGFCGGGGASVGYSRAGFDVVGIDIVPQPRYPFPFILGDFLVILPRMLCGEKFIASDGNRYGINDFKVFHTSPPCKHASRIAKQIRAMRPGRYDHPDLIEPTRAALRATGKLYVIENVEGALLINPVVLCGSWFGLDIRRHRLFEVNFPAFSTPCSHHWQKPRYRSLDGRRKKLASVVGVHGHINYAGEFALRQRAMGIDWMSPEELSQAIPPAYTEWLGRQIMAYLATTA